MTRKLAAAAILLTLAAMSLSATRLDLGTSVYYVRSGFDPSFIVDPPAPGSGDWKAFSRDRGQNLIIYNFGLPGVPVPGVADLIVRPARDFTLACVFEADMSLVNTTALSVLVPQVGQGWSLYLNGALIHDELLRDAAGGLRHQRFLRDIVVPLDKRSLRLGSNVLAFHIVGDPGDEATGLPGGRPLLIDSNANLSIRPQEYLDIALIGVYALFGLYHFILFALRPKNRSYFLYGLAALLFSGFVFARSHTAPNLVRDTALLLDLEDGSLFLCLPVFMAFCEAALGKRVSIVSKAGFGLSLLLACMLPFFRHPPVRLAWEVVAVVELVHIFAFLLVPRLVKRIRGAGPTVRPRLVEILGSDEALIFLSTLVFAGAAVGDIFVVFAGREPFLAKYAFIIFVLGSAAILAGQFTGVYGELESLGGSLERKVAERSAQIAEAIDRQRHLGDELERKSRGLSDASDAEERDLEIAARVQRGFFPTTPPAVEDWDLALAFRPAAKVSGDFFDFYVESQELRGIVVGDVSGHGMGAGLVSVLARSVFGRRWFGNRDLPLGEILSLAHSDLEGEIGSVDEYITCMILRVDKGRVEYANAAHPDLLYRRAGSTKAVAVLPPKDQGEFRGPVLGKSGFECKWASVRFTPGPGDILLAYTDCLEDAKNAKGERFGRERLLESLSKAGEGSAAELLFAVISDIEAFTSSREFSDDLTAIVLKRL